MLWHFYSIVSFLVLLTAASVAASEGGASSLGSNSNRATEKASSYLLLPTPDLFGSVITERRYSGRDEPSRNASSAAVRTDVLRVRTSPLALTLPAPVYSLVGPWLARITPRDHVATPPSTTPALRVYPPWLAESTASLPRLDQVWRATPTGVLAQRYEGLTIDGGTDLGLEVRAGSTKKDRATNTITGTATTHVSLLPDTDALPRFSHYLSMLKMDDARSVINHGQLRMVFATNGTYALNPNTKAVTSSGEVIGTLSWTPTSRERFAQDPWRVVAFRWAPSVSWEGRSLLGMAPHATSPQMPTSTLTGNVRGDLRLDFLSPQLVASGQYHYGQQLTNTPTTWEQATVSWKYQLMNGQVSLGGSFAHGMRGPSLPIERELKLEMGVKF